MLRSLEGVADESHPPPETVDARNTAEQRTATTRSCKTPVEKVEGFFRDEKNNAKGFGVGVAVEGRRVARTAPDLRDRDDSVRDRDKRIDRRA